MFGTVLDIHRPPAAVAVECFTLHNPAILETQPPGETLAALIATLDPADLDMHDLVSYLAASERQLAWTQARQLAAVRALAGRRLVPGRHGQPADTPHPDPMINECAADEVAAALHLTRRAGQQRVWLAVALDRLPHTAAAFTAGHLGLAKVQAIAETLTVLNDHAALVAETRVLGRAPDQTIGNLRRSLARAVHAADPTAAARRAAKAHLERRCYLRPQPDGMCEFYALLPAADAMALWTALTALADTARDTERADAAKAARDAQHGGADPGRAGNEPAPANQNRPADQPGASEPATDHTGPALGTMDQLRADVLADLAYTALNRGDLPRNHRRRPHIQITLAATTALGLDDQHAELTGYGPITAQAARQIAADATWRRLLTDPATGGLLDYGRTTYEPPANLTDHLITRDQTCRGPGCRIPARRCDIDHTIRYPDGPTADHNLTCLCRRCHTRKHQAGRTLEVDPDGNVTWTTPTGHTYTDPVPPVLHTNPPPRAPAEDTPPF